MELLSSDALVERMSLAEQGLEFVVEDEHQGAAGTSDDVGEGALEEGRAALRLGDLDPAVERVLVEDLALGAARLHHHATTDSVERIRHDARDGGDALGDHPVDDQRRLLGVGQHAAGRVVKTEVGGAVDDDALHRHAEATVQTADTVRLDRLGQAVAKTRELALAGSLADVGGQTVRTHQERKNSVNPSIYQVGQQIPPTVLALEGKGEL